MIMENSSHVQGRRRSGIAIDVFGSGVRRDPSPPILDERGPSASSLLEGHHVW